MPNIPPNKKYNIDIAIVKKNIAIKIFDETGIIKLLKNFFIKKYH